MTDAELSVAEDRKNLIALIHEFDHDDAYHGDRELDQKSYYEALNRVVALLRGDIKDWTSVPA